MIKSKLFAAIALSLTLNACSGQKSKNDINQSVNSERQLKENKPNPYNREHALFYLDINNQISQVVRTIFQDSRGNFWFGTQNGAFKLGGDSLIPIDKIIGESGNGVTIKKITESKDSLTSLWQG